MAIDISQGKYTLLKSAKSVLRANFNAVRTTLSGEGVTDYLPDPLQADSASTGTNIYTSDQRIQPQATQYVFLEARRLASRSKPMALGVEDRDFELTALCGVKGFVQNRAATDPSPTPEDAGWQTADNLRRIVVYVLCRYLTADTTNTAYWIEAADGEQQQLDARRPAEYAYKQRFIVRMRIRAPLGEG